MNTHTHMGTEIEWGREESDPGVPSRHGMDLHTSSEMAARLRWFIRTDPQPTHGEWQSLGGALHRGDPLADRLVDWMAEIGMGQAWPIVHAAMAQSAGSAGDLAPALQAFMHAAWQRPVWLSEQRMRRGAHALQTTGIHGMMVLRDAGLMAGYQASAINQTLLKTGALHRGAQPRVAETTDWWLACTGEGAMAPGGVGFVATLRVRIVHALVRRRVIRMADWDPAVWGMPINQVDMQATYLAFSVVQLLSLKVTGWWVSRQDSDDVMHLWRYIGHLMGVEDGLLCESEQEGRVALYRNVLSQAPADESSVQLGRALMDEPLHRHYAWAAGLRGRFNRARHLSLVRWFVGKGGMQRLGLPRSAPWYPLLMALPLACGSVLRATVPGLAPRWRAAARQRQLGYLKVLLGARKGSCGGAHSGAR